MKARVPAWLAAAALALAGSGCDDGMGAYEAHLIAPQAANVQPGVSATWLGTAGLLLSDGTDRILVDPFVSRPGLFEVALDRQLRPDDATIADWIDRIGAQGTGAVFVSHSHYDHAMDAPLFAKRLGARLVGSRSTANIGRGLGLPEAQIETVTGGTAVTAGAFTVTFLDSRHGPALFGRVPFPGEVTAPLTPPAAAEAYRMGGAFSLLIEHPLGTALHHGSAGWIDGMFDGVTAEVVFLGVAGRDETGSYLDAVVDRVGARRIVPMHFDDFFRGLDEPLRPMYFVGLDEFFETAADHKPNLDIETLPIGQQRTLFQ